jgi:hypothetical protein
VLASGTGRCPVSSTSRTEIGDYYDYYAIMDADHAVIPCDHETWIAYYSAGPDARRVAKWERGDVMVSTVFLAVNHGFGDYTGPLWFESLVLVGEMTGEMRRYATWDEAVAGHNELVAEVEATMRTRMITFED